MSRVSVFSFAWFTAASGERACCALCLCLVSGTQCLVSGTRYTVKCKTGERAVQSRSKAKNFAAAATTAMANARRSRAADLAWHHWQILSTQRVALVDFILKDPLVRSRLPVPRDRLLPRPLPRPLPIDPVVIKSLSVALVHMASEAYCACTGEVTAVRSASRASPSVC